MEKKKTILVVDDEPDLRAALADTLRLKGYGVYEAKNGEEAVATAFQQHPDLILLDLAMPGMGGMSALKEIRGDVWGFSAPVIILTNLSATDETLIEDIVLCKPAHFLVKSDWKIHDVARKIKDTLKTAHAR